MAGAGLGYEKKKEKSLVDLPDSHMLYFYGASVRDRRVFQSRGINRDIIIRVGRIADHQAGIIALAISSVL